MTAPWVTAAWPLQVAIDLAILADPTLSALLKGERTYSSIVDESTPGRPKPYVVYGETGEGPKNTFARPGHDTRIKLQIVAEQKYQLMQVYNALTVLLNGTMLSLQDHTMVQGTTELILTFVEQDLSGERGIVEYSVFSLAG